MKDLIKQHSPKKHAKSFKYAFEGILHALLNEPNFRIHIVATAVVITLGLHF
ncbi:MAG: diacylglycerol kinase family protein, partial [Romboutsia sp.]|nr:diacylglycerol kinase family protein [Romboutsia sp.]